MAPQPVRGVGSLSGVCIGLAIRLTQLAESTPGIKLEPLPVPLVRDSIRMVIGLVRILWRLRHND